MNKRFHLITAVLLSSLLIGVQEMYGQNALSRSFNGISKNDSKAVEKSSFQPATENDSSSDQPLAEKLRAVSAQVKDQTTVPVLVPDAMPQSNIEGKVCVTGGSNRDAYVITISEEPECGANAGLIASFTAERNVALPEKFEADKVVELAGGIEGFYTAKSCGASCAPAQIEFVYENVVYTFQFKSADEDGGSDEARLIEAVNSALRSAKN